MHTLGTLVKLRGESELVKNFKLVIVERYIQDPNNSKEYYDYKDTFYPMGAIENNGKGILFNEENIKQVLYYGYKDDQDEVFVDIAKNNSKSKKLNCLNVHIFNYCK